MLLNFILILLICILFFSLGYNVAIERNKVKSFLIESETFGTLIDKLTIENIRIWNNCDDIVNLKDEKKVSEISKKNVIANNRRNKLIQQIDEYMEKVLNGEIIHKSTKQRDTKKYGKNKR